MLNIRQASAAVSVSTSLHRDTGCLVTRCGALFLLFFFRPAHCSLLVIYVKIERSLVVIVYQQLIGE